MDDTEEAKPGDIVTNAIVKGELGLLEQMLKAQDTNGLRQCRYQDSNGKAAYTVAIQEGYVVMVQMLLKYNVPLGDALLRAVDANFVDAVQEICSYARKHMDLREAILNCRCENDDLPLRFTPIILAAYNNNFEIVEILLQMGTFIKEPNSKKAPETIEETHDFIDIYKALCSEAYMSLASVDPIETAFSIHRRLHKLQNLMTDFSAEFEELADRVRCYTGDILGQCRTTEEIMAILTYEENKKPREAPEGTRFLLVKLQRAIEFNQKEFVAHPNCQQVLRTHFYRGLSSYQDWSPVKQIMFTAFTLIGYPIISLVYLLIPSVKIKRFVRIPFVKFLLHTGADMVFLVNMVFITASKDTSGVVSFMINYAVLFTLGLAWMHCKEIFHEGIKKYLSNGRNLINTLILILYTSAFMTEAAGSHQINTEVPQYHLQKQTRSLPVNDMPAGSLKLQHAFHEEQKQRTEIFIDPHIETADVDFRVPLPTEIHEGDARMETLQSGVQRQVHKTDSPYSVSNQRTQHSKSKSDSLNSVLDNKLSKNSDSVSRESSQSDIQRQVHKIDSLGSVSDQRTQPSKSKSDLVNSIFDSSDYPAVIGDVDIASSYNGADEDSLISRNNVVATEDSDASSSFYGADIDSSVDAKFAEFMAILWQSHYTICRSEHPQDEAAETSADGPFGREETSEPLEVSRTDIERDNPSSEGDGGSLGSKKTSESSKDSRTDNERDNPSSEGDIGSFGSEKTSESSKDSKTDIESNNPSSEGDIGSFGSEKTLELLEDSRTDIERDNPSSEGDDGSFGSEKTSEFLEDSRTEGDHPSSEGSPAHSRTKRRSKASDAGSSGGGERDITSVVGSSGYNIYTLDEKDPRVISRLFLALVSMCVAIRLVTLVNVSEAIGPLQISLGAMAMDIVKFLIVYAFIILAFAMGLTQIYAPYLNAGYIKCVGEGGSGCVEGSFSSIGSALQTLGWMLVGYASKNDLKIDTDHTIIKFTGLLLYALYVVLGLVVLLNLLIAMMGITYTNIEENADLEWKFSRTKLWAHYLMQGATVPPPFNLIPSTKTIKRLLYSMFCRKLAEQDYAERCEEKAKMAREIADETHYKRVLKTLVSRYIQHEETTENSTEGSLSLQDVRALKNDIIAFKYESTQKFEVTDTIYEDAKDCAELVSTSTVQVDDIANVVNQAQDESDRQLADIKTLRGLVTEVFELAKESGPLPPRPKPPEPKKPKAVSSVVRAMASDIFESSGQTKDSSAPKLMTALDLLRQAQPKQEQQDDEDAEKRRRTLVRKETRDDLTRQSFTFGDYAQMLQKSSKEEDETSRRSSSPAEFDSAPPDSGRRMSRSVSRRPSSAVGTLEEEPGPSGK